jgi:hypothetical protein
VIAAGQTREVMVVLELPPAAPVATTPFYHRWWFWGGVAVAAAAASTAIFWPRTQGPIPGSAGVTTNADPP